MKNRVLIFRVFHLNEQLSKIMKNSTMTDVLVSCLGNASLTGVSVYGCWWQRSFRAAMVQI